MGTKHTKKLTRKRAKPFLSVTLYEVLNNDEKAGIERRRLHADSGRSIDRVERDTEAHIHT